MYAEAGIRRAGPSLGLKHAAYSVVACMANGAHEGLQARCMAFDAAAWLGCGQVMMYRRPAQRYDVTCRTRVGHSLPRALFYAATIHESHRAIEPGQLPYPFLHLVSGHLDPPALGVNKPHVARVSADKDCSSLAPGPSPAFSPPQLLDLVPTTASPPPAQLSLQSHCYLRRYVGRCLRCLAW